MCGIAGILGLNNGLEYVVNMLNAMHHRGPDDYGTFQDNEICLGHKRLSIIDLSPAGHQPMHNQKGNITIVFNGEIYNYLELKQLLPTSTKLKSTTDTEIIIELYHELGINLLPKLRGMFALAIWDKQKKELLLARDHMGIKPLYYQYKDKVLTFASEMKGMLASGLIQKVVNPKALHQYLKNGYVLQPQSFIQDVLMLPPASYMIFKEGSIQINQYWDLTERPVNIPPTEQDAITEVKKLVIDSVKEEAIADRPLGVFLSGGLDSTVLVAALNESGMKNIKTFSVGFDGDELSEEDDAKEAAKYYNTNHTQLQVSDMDILPYINDYIRAIDQPTIDGLNTWLVSKVTAKHVTVALSGLGGDELFSGYSIDRNILSKKKYMLIGKIIRSIKIIYNITPKKFRIKLQKIATWGNLCDFYQSWGEVFTSEELKQLAPNNPCFENGFKTICPSNKYSLLQRISHLHLRGFMMSRLLRDSDAVSMDHSIEVRFPIIDLRLVKLSFHLPDTWKIKFVDKTSKLKNYEKENSYEQNGVKHLLYQAFKQSLPPQFGLRPKRGFKMPIEKWMKNGLNQDIKETLTLSQTMLNEKAIHIMYEKWHNGEISWTKIWAIYILEKWVKQNIK